MNIDVFPEVLAKIVGDLNGIEEKLCFLGSKNSIGEEH